MFNTFFAHSYTLTVNDIVDVPLVFVSIARQKNIPPPVFYALILQESKRTLKINGDIVSLAWPWTINHQGNSYYFNSKPEVVLFAKSLLNKGDRSFDVGYGQINWRYHSKRFDSIESALEPEINLLESASILYEQYKRAECNTWALAIGCYHRPAQRDIDRKIANNYAESVIGIWLSLYK